MGTRSLTTFIETWKDKKTNKKKKVEIVTLYRQYDGYPKGHGAQLAEFLRRGRIVNGIPYGDDGIFFNGMGCLAAQCVAHFKDGPGGFYLHRGGTKDCWEEYRYEVILNQDTNKLTMRCYSVYDDKWIFDGEAKEFIEQLEEIEKTNN